MSIYDHLAMIQKFSGYVSDDEKYKLVGTKEFLFDEKTMKAFHQSPYYKGLKAWGEVQEEILLKRIKVLTAVVEKTLGRKIDVEKDQGRVRIMRHPTHHDTEWVTLDGKMLGSLSMVWNPTLQEQINSGYVAEKYTVRFDFIPVKDDERL